jgi:hypothetical protein
MSAVTAGFHLDLEHTRVAGVRLRIPGNMGGRVVPASLARTLSVPPSSPAFCLFWELPNILPGQRTCLLLHQES